MKILLADPHAEVRAALRLVIAQQPGFTFLAETSDLLHLLAFCARECPDLILLDFDLLRPVSRGASAPALIETIGLLRRFCPRSKVVAMSARFEDQYEALNCGANGFISKTDAPDVVCAVIAQVCKNSPQN